VQVLECFLPREKGGLPLLMRSIHRWEVPPKQGLEWEQLLPLVLDPGQTFGFRVLLAGRQPGRAVFNSPASKLGLARAASSSAAAVASTFANTIMPVLFRPKRDSKYSST